MPRHRAADDFPAIRTRLQELQRERAQAQRRNDHALMVETYQNSVKRILGTPENTGRGPFRNRG